MAFRGEVTPEAKQDANEILEWLYLQEAGEAGLRWFRGLSEAIESLSGLPKRCPLAPENASVPFEMRQLLYGRKPHLYPSCSRLRVMWCMCFASATGDAAAWMSHIKKPSRSDFMNMSDSDITEQEPIILAFSDDRRVTFNPELTTRIWEAVRNGYYSGPQELVDRALDALFNH